MRIGDEFLEDDTPIFFCSRLCRLYFRGHFSLRRARTKRLCKNIAGLTGGDRLTDFAPGCRLKIGGIAHLQYVDNFAALGGDLASLTQVKEGVRQIMGTRGLLMRELEDAGKGVAELLGHTIKAIEGTISISPKRAWRLRDAMLHASRLRNLSGMALEVIWFLFFFLVRRCLLSVFGRAYAFVQAHYSAPAPLWRSVRRELRNAACLLPLAFSNLRRPWNPNVWSDDAAPRGVAAHTSTWPDRSVAGIGRLDGTLEMEVNRRNEPRPSGSCLG